MIQKIAVYCGAATGSLPVYRDAAIKLGQYLANHGLELVYGGSDVGLMGVLADTVMRNNGIVHGVIPQNLADRGAKADNITDLTIVADITTRKQHMLAMSDGCIALPGGPGTLEEIIDAYSWARLGDNSNPCVFFNVNHYYDPLQTLFDQMVQQEFLTAEHRSKLKFADNLTEIFDFMKHYTPPAIRTNYDH